MLLVEDEDYSAWATTSVAAQLGVEVGCRASSGAEAMRRLDEAEYDLVLLDRRLPDMDGAEVCRALRSGDRGRRTSIVAVTGSADGDGVSSCRAAGFDALLAKPVTADALGAALSTAAGLRLLRFLSDGTPDGFTDQARRYCEVMEQLMTAIEHANFEQTAAGVRDAAHRLQGHARMTDSHAIGACAAVERDAGAPASIRTQTIARLRAEVSKSVSGLGFPAR